jgi:hypothetical protein
MGKRMASPETTPLTIHLPYDKTAPLWNVLLYKRVPNTVKPKPNTHIQDNSVECAEFLPSNGR